MGRRRRPLLRWMRGTRPWRGRSKLAWREHGSRCVVLWPWSHRIGRGCELRGRLQYSRRLLLLLLLLPIRRERSRWFTRWRRIVGEGGRVVMSSLPQRRSWISRRRILGLNQRISDRKVVNLFPYGQKVYQTLLPCNQGVINHINSSPHSHSPQRLLFQRQILQLQPLLLQEPWNVIEIRDAVAALLIYLIASFGLLVISRSLGTQTIEK